MIWIQEQKGPDGDNKGDYKFRGFQKGGGKILGDILISGYFESKVSHDKKDESSRIEVKRSEITLFLGLNEMIDKVHRYMLVVFHHPCRRPEKRYREGCIHWFRWTQAMGRLNMNRMTIPAQTATVIKAANDSCQYGKKVKQPIKRFAHFCQQAFFFIRLFIHIEGKNLLPLMETL